MSLGKTNNVQQCFKVDIIKMDDLSFFFCCFVFLRYNKYALFFYGKYALNLFNLYILLGEMQIKKMFVRHFDK